VPTLALYTSHSEEWATSPELFARLDARFHFTLDVCATAENAKCAAYYTREQDGLARPWAGRVWCNPPYGRRGAGIGAWVRRGFDAASTGEAEVVVLLVPSRTDTAWWHEWCERGKVEFLKGRQRFGSGEYAAPFASALVVFSNAQKRYETAGSAPA
jgi:phage N-6-adenine-methyltransferase